MLRVLWRRAHDTPRDSRGDSTHDLVANRPESASPFLDRQRCSTLLADQHDLITNHNGINTIGISAEVDHQLIHRHHANNRPLTTTDENRATYC